MVAEAIDFDREVTCLVETSRVDKASGLPIWGGRFGEDRLEEFLKAWDFSQMPYCIWEYTHRIEFAQGKLPQAVDYDLLERGRVFGKNGDLGLRRDGKVFLWHFIGAERVSAPAGYGEKNFWEENPDAALRQRDESALLWGAYKEESERWQEDRVGWADLRYPHPGIKEQRLWIHYTVYTDGGQVAFVWWKELKANG